LGRVVIDQLSKRYRYRRHGKGSFLPRIVLHSGVGGDQFWALRDVSFEVKPGQMLGIVGPNGAGKSTLLRLIGGVGRPSGGGIHVAGRVGSLLELGSDFHPELTGRENVVLSGIIAGLRRRDVLSRMDDIIEFADMGDFIDSPVRVYSQGMLLRLAFSIAVHTDPEVLLIDEVLAVGDTAFRRKCVERIERIRRGGCAIILVTHDNQLAASMCDTVLWLNRGVVVQSGDPEAVVAAYMASSAWETRQRTPADHPVVLTADGHELLTLENRFGSLDLQITDVRLLDANGYICRNLRRGEPLRVEIDYVSDQLLPAPIFGVQIEHEDKTILFDGFIPGTDLGLETVKGAGSVAINFERLDLNSGVYQVHVGAYRHDWSYAYDFHWRAYSFTVISFGPSKGVVNPPHEWERSVPRIRAI